MSQKLALHFNATEHKGDDFISTLDELDHTLKCKCNFVCYYCIKNIKSHPVLTLSCKLAPLFFDTKEEIQSSQPKRPNSKSPLETIATSGVYWPTSPSALLRSLAWSAVAAAVVAAVLDDVTYGWGEGESLLFRSRVEQGHERPFTSTVKPQPRHHRFTLTTLQTGDARKPPKKQEWGKQDVFTVNCVADATAICAKVGPKQNFLLD